MGRTENSLQGGKVGPSDNNSTMDTNQEEDKMKRRPMMFVTVATLGMMLMAGEVLAANGRGAGKQNGSHVQAQTNTTGTAAVRPAGSQRRDGTFLTTGTTANGGSTRPGRGQGLQDGTGK